MHYRLLAERRELKYRKRYDACGKILNQVVDVALKAAEYREYTEKYALAYRN